MMNLYKIRNLNLSSMMFHKFQSLLQEVDRNHNLQRKPISNRHKVKNKFPHLQSRTLKWQEFPSLCKIWRVAWNHIWSKVPKELKWGIHKYQNHRLMRRVIPCTSSSCSLLLLFLLRLFCLLWLLIGKLGEGEIEKSRESDSKNKFVLEIIIRKYSFYIVTT